MRINKHSDKIKTVLVSVLYLFIIAAFLVFHTYRSTSLDGRMNHAEDLFKKGKVAIALENYEKLVRTYPNNYYLHLRLGKLFLEVNEPDKAKVEIYRAMSLAPKNNFEAHFEMANLYFKYDEPELAEDVVSKIENDSLFYVLVKKAEFYEMWGDAIGEKDYPEALRKYKNAYDYYLKAKSIKFPAFRKKLVDVYIEFADALMIEGEVKDAAKMLLLANKIKETSEADYRLAIIYKPDSILKALPYYKAAYTLTKDNFYTAKYFDALVETTRYYESNGDKISAKYYNYIAKKLKPDNDVPIKTDKNIL